MAALRAGCDVGLDVDLHLSEQSDELGVGGGCRGG